MMRRQLPLSLFAFILLAPVGALGQDPFQLTTDDITYNAGSTVRFRTVPGISPSFPAPARQAQSELSFRALVRYAGEEMPVAPPIALPATLFFNSPAHPSGYRLLWKIPPGARTGRYEIDVEGRNAKTGETVFRYPRAASFAVHRKLVRIERLELAKEFYTSGDPVAARVVLRNQAGRALHGLRVEFSDRYWPWIAQTAQRAGIDYSLLGEGVALLPGGARELRSDKAATAATVKLPSMHQYAVVVWDRERKNVLDIAFSALTLIRPPGIEMPEPYPGQFLHPDLTRMDTTTYRRFYPPAVVSPAIELDRSHTMFPPGASAPIVYTVHHPTAEALPNLRVIARILGSGGRELSKNVVVERMSLEQGGEPVKGLVPLTLPSEAGLYTLELELADSAGARLASSTLELGVNPLPKSILIFCAHEDDEGAHSGIIRAAVENGIPVHFVYFTSGDAGSCDRYYEHSCGPAEALNFGMIRMEEARSAVAHLGVARENLYFLGLPDGGSEEIWKHHVKASAPYLSVLLASDHAPYDGVARPNLPYAREPVVEAAKDFIRKFNPEVIYTGHPDERHVDHRTNNWFVVKALQELLKEGAVSPDLALLTDQSYGPGPQPHAPFQYRKQVLYVSADAMTLAQEAWWFHQSQDGNRAQGNLRSYDKLPRQEVHWQILDWKDHEGWNEKD